MPTVETVFKRLLGLYVVLSGVSGVAGFLVMITATKTSDGVAGDMMILNVGLAARACLAWPAGFLWIVAVVGLYRVRWWGRWAAFGYTLLAFIMLAATHAVRVGARIEWDRSGHFSFLSAASGHAATLLWGGLLVLAMTHPMKARFDRRRRSADTLDDR